MLDFNQQAVPPASHVQGGAQVFYDPNLHGAIAQDRAAWRGDYLVKMRRDLVPLAPEAHWTRSPVQTDAGMDTTM